MGDKIPECSDLRPLDLQVETPCAFGYSGRHFAEQDEVHERGEQICAVFVRYKQLR